MGGGLSRKEINELAKETKLTKKEIKETFKSFEQKYPEGKMDKVTFLWEAKEAFGGTPKFWEKVFAGLDMDGNGEVEFREYLVALAVIFGQKPAEKLKLSFQMFDADKNGKIDKEEFNSLIKIMVQMGGLSTNKDVLRGKSYEELSKELFEKLDLDKDNTISLEEWLKVGLENQEIQNVLIGHLEEGLFANTNNKK